MPANPYDLERSISRFRHQRWLVDAVVKSVGPEFDQGRLHYLGAPMAPDYLSRVLALKSKIQRLDDITAEFAGLARTIEMQAEQALADGHDLTASDGFFAASIMYGGAQWPIFENSELNVVLEDKKNSCYSKYRKGADHTIEAVEIPYQDKTLPAYLHIPKGLEGKRLPCLVMIEGMDTFKELAIACGGDRFLRRGFACLVIDGPGQGSSLLKEIWYDPDAYAEVGTSTVDWLLNRPEIDPDLIMAWGLSFGSYWATTIVAAEPRFAACAVMFTNFHPHNWPMFEMAAPTFKLRFMYMTGVQDESELDELAQKIDVRPMSGKISVPYFVMAGEDDLLSDLGKTVDHVNALTGDKTLVVYAGEEHGMGNSPSSQLGSPFSNLIADWLQDRAHGKRLKSTYNVVDRMGKMHTENWGGDRVYHRGAPLGTKQLYSNNPPFGLS